MRKNIMEYQEEAIIRYFIKRKDCLTRFFHRIKTSLIRSVKRPFSLKAGRRLSHVSDLLEMDKSQYNINKMVTEDFSTVQEIEFVNSGNTSEPTNETENQTVNMVNEEEENWDVDDIAPLYDQLYKEAIQPQIEAMQPLNTLEESYNEVSAESTTDSESMLRGTLRWGARTGSLQTLVDDEYFNNWNMSIDGFEHDDSTNSINNEDDFYVLSEDSITQQLNEEIAYGCNAISYTDTHPEAMDRCSRGLLRFNFKIENANAFFSRYNKATSGSFKCRNLSFILIVVHNARGLTSVFLQRSEANEDDVANNLDIIASCAISVINPITNAKYTKFFDNHLYRANSDWGYRNFFDGVHGSELVHNDCLVFEVEVKADPPYCYSSFSRAITGYVGIRNQGATCYMNSLLQVLFLLPKFRTACYRIPTEMDSNKSMALALQQVFYNLQFSDTAVNTISLTNSFGWSSVDVLMQHDIQEMMRILIDKIERRMKNTLLEPILPDMFQGKFISYVRCRDIEFNSQREEVFYDIQLSLENAENLYESFKNYVATEIMDNENKFHAGEFGLQAAEKGTLFTVLPPVMFLHLLRFQFDPTTNQVVKNNNFYEFYDQVDLTEFVDKEENITWKYTLFAVLSHSGSGSQGHYVAYVNPTLQQNWLKFDDDTISICHKCDAIDANFGSAREVDEWTRSMQLNAYMLVYIRDIDADEILSPVDPMYITEEIANSAKKDAEPEYFYNMMNKHHFTYVINVFLNMMLESNLHFELDHRATVMPKFEVSRETTANEFKKTLQKVFNVPNDNQIRIWAIANSKTSISQPFFINEDQSIVQTLSERRGYSCSYRVWAEIALPECELPQFDQFKTILVFYYYYCARDCCSYYIDYGYHDKNTKIDELVPILNEKMEWSNRELNIYQEMSDLEIQELVSSNYLSDYSNQTYNTFVMKVVFEPKEHDETMELHNICLYYNNWASQVQLTLRNDDWNKSEQYTITCSVNTTFPTILNDLAHRLRYDPKRIQIFKCNFKNDGKGDALPSTSTESLSVLLNCVGRQQLSLFYKLLHVDVIDIETKQPFTFRCFSIDFKNTERYTLYISDTDSLEHILAAAANLINVDITNGSVGLRLLLCSYDEKVKIITDSKQIYQYLDIRTIYNRKYFQIEEIPKGYEILNENEKNIVVILASNHCKDTKARPLVMKINFNEPWQSVKEAIRNRLNMSESNWEDLRTVLSDQDKGVLVINDTQCLNDFAQNVTSFTINLNYRNRNKRYISR